MQNRVSDESSYQKGLDSGMISGITGISEVGIYDNDYSSGHLHASITIDAFKRLLMRSTDKELKDLNLKLERGSFELDYTFLGQKTIVKFTKKEHLSFIAELIKAARQFQDCRKQNHAFYKRIENQSYIGDFFRSIANAPGLNIAGDTHDDLKRKLDRDFNRAFLYNLKQNKKNPNLIRHFELSLNDSKRAIANLATLFSDIYYNVANFFIGMFSSKPKYLTSSQKVRLSAKSYINDLSGKDEPTIKSNIEMSSWVKKAKDSDTSVGLKSPAESKEQRPVGKQQTNSSISSVRKRRL